MFGGLKEFIEQLNHEYLEFIFLEISNSIEENIKKKFDEINSSTNLKRNILSKMYELFPQLDKDKLKEKIENFKIEFKKENLEIPKLDSNQTEVIYRFDEDENGKISYILYNYHENGSGVLNIPVTKSFFLSMRDLKKVKKDVNNSE